MERHYAHVDVLLAKEKFKTFAFRWMILSKVNRMKKIDKDSYEFTKASIEVQELVKTDLDYRIEVATQNIKEKLQQSKQERYNTN